MNWNPTIVTIVIATAAFIVSLFGASWLNQRSNAQQTETLRLLLEAQTKLLEAKLDAIRAEFSGELKALRGDLQNLTARVERLEKQIDALTIKPIFSKTGD